MTSMPHPDARQDTLVRTVRCYGLVLVLTGAPVGARVRLTGSGEGDAPWRGTFTYCTSMLVDCGRMDVIKISPRGYCYGVVDAIQLAKTVAKDPHTPRPIYVLGQIVHNQHAVEGLEAFGIVTLDGPDRLSILENVSTGTVILTAHGVSPQVKERARAKGLTCIDATCPDVTRTHDLVVNLVAQGYEIIYIGKRGHP